MPRLPLSLVTLAILGISMHAGASEPPTYWSIPDTCRQGLVVQCLNDLAPLLGCDDGTAAEGNSGSEETCLICLEFTPLEEGIAFPTESKIIDLNPAAGGAYLTWWGLMLRSSDQGFAGLVSGEWAAKRSTGIAEIACPAEN